MTQEAAGGASRGLVAWSLVLGLLGAGSAFAQSHPTGAAGTPPVTQNQGWSFYVTTQGTYESNPIFAAPPDDNSDLSGSGGGGFTFTHSGPRGSINLSGDGSALFYRELTDLNTITYGGNLNGSYRSGPKTNLTFSGSVNSDYARHSQLLLDEGIVLPQTQVLTMRFSAGLSHSLSTRTTLSLTGRFEEARFDSDALSNGFTLGGTLSLSRQVSQTTSLSLGYTHDLSDSDIQRANINTAFVGTRMNLNPRTDLELNAGATVFPDRTGGQTVAPYGAATLTLKYPRLNMSMGYNHQVTQEYGLGSVRESDLALLGLSRSFGGRHPVIFSASLNYSYNRSPFSLNQEVDYQTYGATTGLKVPIARSLRADAGYSYFRSSQRAPVLDSHSVFVAFSYRFEPH